MKKAADHLGNSFLIRILRNQVRTLSRASIFTQQDDYPIMESVIDFIQANLPQLPLMTQVYFHTYEAFLHPEDLGFFSVAKSVMSESVKQFSKLEANELYNAILNLATQQLNQGNLEFLPLIFETYQQLLSVGILQSRGKIGATHFKNMVNVACHLNKFDWVEEFIGTWTGKVSPDHAQNALNFNLGTLHRYKKEFEQAERYFNLVLNDFKDVFYGLKNCT